MSPPEHAFPVGDLEARVQYRRVDFKEKSRKLGDFGLQDCQLLELVQYSCTTPEQQYQRAIQSPTGKARMECWPFVRLFRKCEKNGKTFHVETTAWEGQHAWKPPHDARPTAGMTNKDDRPSDKTSSDSYANYGNYFGSK